MDASRLPTHLPETVNLLDALRSAIVHGEFSPSQRLVENDLAERYGTSRGAVREALALLDNEGLVARERNRGAWVRPVSLDEAIEITEVRASLEGMCAAKAALAMTSTERRDLKQLGTRMQKAVKAEDLMLYNETSQEVHERIRSFAAQQTANEILDRLRYKSVRYQYSITLLPGRSNDGMVEHLAVIKAVTSGDPDIAEQTMRTHLMSVIDALRRLSTLSPLMTQFNAI